MTQLTLVQSAPALSTQKPVRNFKLEPFQQQLKRDTYAQLQKHDRVLAIAGCGAGKTILSSDIISDYVENQGRCLFIVDSECLINQTAKKMWAGFGIRPAIYQGTKKFSPYSPVVVASMQTISARLRARKTPDEMFYKPFDLVIPDEAHTSCWWTGFEQIEEYTLLNGGKILGLTATPWRTKPEEYMGMRFDATAIAPSNRKMVELGRVVPNRSFGFDREFDVSRLDKTEDGEYREDQVEAIAVTKAAIDCIVRNYKKIGYGRPTSAYCVTIDHAKKLAEAFNEAGIPAEYQEGSTPGPERDRQDARLESGKTMVLCSVGTRIAGWDLSCISCIAYTYPTSSKARFFQAVGRGSRIHPGKTDYLILDFGTNIKRLGDPMEEQDYGIELKTKKEGDLTEKFKVCESCFLIVSRFTSVCPDCGHVFEKEVKENDPDEEGQGDDEDEIDESLVEIFSAATLEMLSYLRDAKRFHYRKGNRPDSARDNVVSKYGRLCPVEWERGLLFGSAPSFAEQLAFLDYLIGFNYSRTWVFDQLACEFGQDWRSKRNMAFLVQKVDGLYPELYNEATKLIGPATELT